MIQARDKRRSHKSSCYVPDAPRLPIRFLKNVCAHHIAHLAHVILQVFPLRFEGQVADKDASALNVIAVGVNLHASAAITAIG